MITEEQVKHRTPKRFWEKIRFDEPDKCWIWMSGKSDEGYGRFSLRINNKKYSPPAHRFMYDKVVQEVNPKMDVCHNCPDGDNRACVNPNHLWMGTNLENLKDRDNKGRNVFGSRVNHAKLNEKTVLIIKLRSILTKQTFQSIANEFGVDIRTIYRINAGAIWKHVKVNIPHERRKHKNLIQLNK